MKDRMRWMRAMRVVRRAGLVLAAVSVLGFASAALAIVTVRVTTSDGERGGTVTMTISVEREEGDGELAGTQVDVTFDRAQLMIAGACTGDASECDSGQGCPDADACILPSCAADERLPEALQGIANSPRFQNLPDEQKKIRLGVVGPVVPVTPFEDGDLISCTMQVPEDAPTGLQNLRGGRLLVSDEEGNEVEAVIDIVAGCIGECPTPTRTDTVEPTRTDTPTTPPAPTTPPMSPTTPPITEGPTDTPTRTDTPTEGTPTNTPTATLPVRAIPDDDGCSCRIDPRTGRATGSVPWQAALLPVALWAWRRRERNGNRPN